MKCASIVGKLYQPLAFINSDPDWKPKRSQIHTTHTHTSNHRQQMAILLFFFYLHSCSLCFIPSHRVRIVFFIWTDLLFALCAPHSEKTINRERKTKSGENVYFHTENQQMFFIDVLMNIKWVFIEINTIECVRRAICLLRLFKYILTRTSAISVAACTTFEFSCFFFSSHSA